MTYVYLNKIIIQYMAIKNWPEPTGHVGASGTRFIDSENSECVKGYK